MDDEIKKVEYPQSHPKAQEIKEIKARLEDLYKELNLTREKAREAYKEAGVCTNHIVDVLKETAELMEKLESFVTLPLI